MEIRVGLSFTQLKHLTQITECSGRNTELECEERTKRFYFDTRTKFCQPYLVNSNAILLQEVYRDVLVLLHQKNAWTLAKISKQIAVSSLLGTISGLTLKNVMQRF
jgi:predicted transglutaminase-like protease